MIALKYLLVILGIGLFGSAGALVVYDVYVSSQLRRLLRHCLEKDPQKRQRHIGDVMALVDDIPDTPAPIAARPARSARRISVCK